MIVTSLSIATGISAMTAIFFRIKDDVKNYAIFKPLTTILIILLALFFNVENFSNYGLLVIIGLILSLIGDVFLIKEDLFVYGLGSFLFAHILFTLAFTSISGFLLNPIVLGILLIIGFFYYRFLSPSLGSYATPVAFYFLAIIVMDWQAISLAMEQKTEVFYSVGFAAVLFSCSDAIIAYKKFKHDFKIAEVLILSFYWLSIFLICLSCKSLG